MQYKVYVHHFPIHYIPSCLLPVMTIQKDYTCFILFEWLHTNDQEQSGNNDKHSNILLNGYFTKHSHSHSLSINVRPPGDRKQRSRKGQDMRKPCSHRVSPFKHQLNLMKLFSENVFYSDCFLYFCYCIDDRIHCIFSSILYLYHYMKGKMNLMPYSRPW